MVRIETIFWQYTDTKVEMMNNLIEIQNQIEKLTKQASEIKAREFDKTVQEPNYSDGIHLPSRFAVRWSQCWGRCRRNMSVRARPLQAGRWPVTSTPKSGTSNKHGRNNEFVPDAGLY